MIKHADILRQQNLANETGFHQCCDIVGSHVFGLVVQIADVVDFEVNSFLCNRQQKIDADSIPPPRVTPPLP